MMRLDFMKQKNLIYFIEAKTFPKLVSIDSDDAIVYYDSKFNFFFMKTKNF